MEGICTPNPMEATTSIGRPNQFFLWLFLEVLSEELTSVSSMSENKPQKRAEI